MGQTVKPCQQNIAKREVLTDLIFSMYVNHIQNKNPFVFGGDQRSLEVNIHVSNCGNISNMIYQERKLALVSYLHVQ